MRKYLRAYSLSFCLAAAACLHAQNGRADPVGPLLPTTGGQIFKTYEIYRDGADPNVHYALRTQPVLATAQNGGAIFSMEKFDGETARLAGRSPPRSPCRTTPATSTASGPARTSGRCHSSRTRTT
ncbi:hypothetical protein BTHI11S_05155 [Bosea thiooxidans]